jgi:hypothetical protein
MVRADEGATAGVSAIRVGRAIFCSAVVVVVAAAAPVIWRGALLADDFNNCLAPIEMGIAGFLSASWDRLGMIRLARFVEILLTTGVCRGLPFGIAIAVPLVLTLTVAWQARALLRDLGTPAPWGDVGGAMWLLQPLGTEAALWPAALHVPLGLTLAVLALRAYRRGRYGWAALATLAAAFSVEQTIASLPLCAWLLTPSVDRRRAAFTASGVAVAVLVVFAVWSGADPRLRVSVGERIATVISDVRFYVGFPVVGLGLHSIPLAVWWALPWSVAVLAVGGIVGWLTGPYLPAATLPLRREAPLRFLLAIATIVVLTNLVVVLGVPHQGSPRVFAPTWLVLSIAAAMGGASARWRRPRLLGTAAGLFAAGAVLSLVFSSSVRVQSANFTARAASIIASRIADGDSMAVCGVRRTVVQPAPRGAFAVHEFIYEWAAERAVQYYTGRRATIHLSGELWNRPCPPVEGVDAIVEFDELLAGASP